MINRAFSYLKNQPQGFFTLLLTETCALFGFFGITSLLVLYMTNVLHVSDAISFIIYGSFSAFIYATPIIGGPIADKFFGYKYSIYIGLIIMIIGNFLITYHNINLFYLGLGCFAVGSGFFTPAFNTLVSKIYHHYEEKRDNAFTIYYMSKNLGGLLAIVICAFVATHISYSVAFLLCSLVMFLGFILLFIMKKNIHPYLPTLKKINFFKVTSITIVILMTIVLTTLLMAKESSYIVMIIMALLATVFMFYLYRKVNKTQKFDLLAIILATLLFIIFGMFLGEGGTTLNLFIERIVNRTVFNMTIPPSTFYALDPFFMILLGGFMMYLLSYMKEKDYTFASLKKAALGLSLLGIGFLIFTVAAQQYISFNIRPSILYVVAAYALFPLAELCISPIVLSLTTRLAPKGYEAMMVGFYLVGYALGFYLTGVFSIIGNVKPNDNLIQAATSYRDAFLLSAVCLLLSALVTYLILLYCQRRRHQSVQLSCD